MNSTQLNGPVTYMTAIVSGAEGFSMAEKHHFVQRSVAAISIMLLYGDEGGAHTPPTYSVVIILLVHDAANAMLW